jgi:hypothetical protein
MTIISDETTVLEEPLAITADREPEDDEDDADKPLVYDEDSKNLIPVFQQKRFRNRMGVTS